MEHVSHHKRSRGEVLGARFGDTSAGFTLFYAVLVASLMLSLGLAIFNITYKELLISGSARDSTLAFYAADTALECALFWDLKHTGLSSPAFGFFGDSLSSGLIGYWRFEEGEGDTTRDWSGQGNDGTLTNMDTATAWIEDGALGDALAFDGADDHVLLEDIDYTNEMTGSMWIRPRSLATQQMLISQSDSIELQVQIQPPAAGNKIRVRVDAGAGADIVDSNDQPILNEWQHVAWTYNGTFLDVFINGQRDMTTVQSTGSGNIADRDEAYAIGARNNGIRLFNGDIDDVRIYNRVLEDDEIEAMFDKDPHNQFTNPVAAGTPNVMCGGQLVTMAGPPNNWTTTPDGEESATTTFDIVLQNDESDQNDQCASVEVAKNTSTTTIIARGYNTCNFTNPRRVERAIRAQY